MISKSRLHSIIGQGKCLSIAFLGLPNKTGQRANIYQYNHKRWTITGIKADRLTCDTMLIGRKGERTKHQYSRSYRKICMILKGDQLLYGRRCLKCGAAVPKSHGNCFDCYSEKIESRFGPEPSPHQIQAEEAHISLEAEKELVQTMYENGQACS